MKKLNLSYQLTFIVAAILSLAAVHPLPSSAETLEETLAATLANSPRITAAQHGVSAANYKVAQDKAASGVVIDANASVGLNHFEAEPVVSGKTFKARNANLSMSLPLYTSGQLEAKSLSAKYQSDAASWDLAQTEQSVLFDASTAFLNVARAERGVDLAKAHEKLLGSELAQALAELRNGLRTRTDTAQAEARLAASTSVLRAADASLQSARFKYQSTVGRMPEGPLSLPDLQVPDGRDEAIDGILRDSPRLAQLGSLRDAADAQISLAKALGKPTVSLSAALSRERENNPVLVNQTSQSVTLKVTLPIYDSGMRNAQVGQALSLRAQIESNRETLLSDLRSDAATAWELLQSSQAQLTARGVQARASRIALEGARAEYKAGTRTLLDVLNAEQELLDAKTEELNTAIERVSSVLRLKALRGQLTAG